MGWLIVLFAGTVLGGVATLDAHLGHPGMPGWSLPLLGAIVTGGMLIAEVLDR